MPSHHHADSYPRWIALALAHALLADAERSCARTASALQARAANCLGQAPTWLKQMAERLSRLSSPAWQAHTVQTLADHLQGLDEFQAAFDPSKFAVPRVRRLLLRPATMGLPPLGLEHCDLPALPTVDALAAWLGIDQARLSWLAGPARHYREATGPAEGVAPRPQPAQHYRALLRAKRSGGLRLIEAPKSELKRLQRHVLDGLLARLPVHEAAHGFVAGRGVESHASLHAGRACVIAFDLQDFFCSIGCARIEALWRTLGYPEGVAGVLATLCTTRTPAMVRERMQAESGLDFLAAKRLASPHLPQGAPTSPALANLCAFGLDLRLDGLAHRFGARYSRYADDLVFSGPADLGRRWRVLHAWVDSIARDEGFRLREEKTRRMTNAARQRVTGVVVNERPNLAREDYDALRAELHQLGRASAVDRGLRAPLLGRLAWAQRFLVPARGLKLQRLFERIVFLPMPGASLQNHLPSVPRSSDE